MLKYLGYGTIFLFAIACGKSNERKNRDQNLLPGAEDQIAALAGTYQQAENGQARIQISNENIVIGTTLEIPAPSGNGARLTPRFPQGLIYNPTADNFTTIGTYNDGTAVFKNVELKLRLYEQNRYLDVTLTIPPNEALVSKRSQKSTDCPGDVSQNPGQSNPCPVCPDPRLIYVYRFVRI